jgi:hypothetical protein
VPNVRLNLTDFAQVAQVLDSYTWLCATVAISRRFQISDLNVLHLYAVYHVPRRVWRILCEGRLCSNFTAQRNNKKIKIRLSTD